MDRIDATPPATADATESATAAVRPAKASSSRARGRPGQPAAAGRARKQAAKPARRAVGQAAAETKAARPAQPGGKAKGKAKSEIKSGARRDAKAPASPAKPRAAKTSPPAKAEGSDKGERVKLVRDSFTMPKSDVDLIGLLKQRALKLGREVKKSELLRAGLHALAAFDDAAFTRAVAAVPRLKTGRPHQKKNR